MITYVYAWTAHPKQGGKLQKGVPKYPNGNGWKPIFDKDGQPIYVKTAETATWYERVDD